jgi:tripartite-type tricarboxylate transporter receptor subunit TctC
MMVPFPAGGTADLLARGTAQALSDAFGQPFVVENRAGASGNLAAGAVARSAPDGSSLLFASQAQAALNKFLFKSLPYDPSRDLVPVVLVIKSPVALVAGADAPVSSFQSMIDYAKANPAQHRADGHRLHGAYRLRTVTAEGGHQAERRCLQGWRTNGGRSARRPSSSGLGPAFELHSARQGKKG